MSDQLKTGRKMFLSAEELMVEDEEHRQKMDHEVVVEDGYIGFPRFSYWIKLRRVSSHRKIVGLATHLLEKDWVSRDMLLEFIEKAGSHHRLDVHSDV